jgi:hypothetical protein
VLEVIAAAYRSAEIGCRVAVTPKRPESRHRSRWEPRRPSGMTATTRAVIVGAGLMGRWHADAVQRSGDAWPRWWIARSKRLGVARATAARPPHQACRQHSGPASRRRPRLHTAGHARALALEALEASRHVVVESAAGAEPRRDRASTGAGGAEARVVVRSSSSCSRTDPRAVVQPRAPGAVGPRAGTALRWRRPDGRGRATASRSRSSRISSLTERLLRVAVSGIDLRLERSGPASWS